MRAINKHITCIGLAAQLVFASCIYSSSNNSVNEYENCRQQSQVLFSQEYQEQRGIESVVESLDENGKQMIIGKDSEEPSKACGNEKNAQERKDIEKIPILMYHEIGYPEESSFSSRYVVTPENFRQQLEFLHSNNYIPISIDEYLQDDFSQVPDNKKPVIITFDDATEGQFRYNDKDIDPDSAVGILDEFAKEYDGWRQRAAFFIDFADRDGNFQVPFAERGKEKEKISYLKENGYEVYCHTKSHISLKEASYKEIVNDIKNYKYQMEQKDIEKSDVIAVPYGAFPQKDKKWEFLDEKFDYYFAAFARTQDKRASRVDSEDFDNKYIPRIEVPPNNLKNLESYLNGY